MQLVTDEGMNSLSKSLVQLTQLTQLHLDFSYGSKIFLAVIINLHLTNAAIKLPMKE